MEANISRLTHKLAIQLRLVTAVPFAVLAPGGQSGDLGTPSCFAWNQTH